MGIRFEAQWNVDPYQEVAVVALTSAYLIAADTLTASETSSSSVRSSQLAQQMGTDSISATKPASKSKSWHKSSAAIAQIYPCSTIAANFV